MILEKSTGDKILIVDDEVEMCSVLRRYFEQEGTECAASPNAYDALDKIEDQNFSLVICDALMPGMPGVEFLRQVKKLHPEMAFIMITGFLDIDTAVSSLRIGAHDFITKPFELSALRHAVDRALDRRRLFIENRWHREKLTQNIRERTRELNEVLNDVEESYKITLEALVAALDAREHETKAHSQRVREYAMTLAIDVGLKHDDLIQTGRGALLHDVGKIGVRDSILLKPEKLNEGEWAEMKKHPQIGYNILRNIEFLCPAAEIVLCHHERWDGKGYPNGLADEDIPLGARIFAIADTLDAMTSNRPYRKALTFESAWNEIRACSGTQFDPHIADAFLALPPESWIAIHDSVNRLHHYKDCFDDICLNLTTSQ
jgi:putative two-component system response regulator